LLLDFEIVFVRNSIAPRFLISTLHDRLYHFYATATSQSLYSWMSHFYETFFRPYLMGFLNILASDV